jgi:hypothetical protein
VILRGPPGYVRSDNGPGFTAKTPVGAPALKGQGELNVGRKSLTREMVRSTGLRLR